MTLIIQVGVENAARGTGTFCTASKVICRLQDWFASDFLVVLRKNHTFLSTKDYNTHIPAGISEMEPEKWGDFPSQNLLDSKKGSQTTAWMSIFCSGWYLDERNQVVEKSYGEKCDCWFWLLRNWRIGGGGDCDSYFCEGIFLVTLRMFKFTPGHSKLPPFSKCKAYEVVAFPSKWKVSALPSRWLYDFWGDWWTQSTL